MSRRRGVVLLLITGMLLVGCVPEPGDAGAVQNSTAPASPSASSTAAPADPAVALPDDCNDLLSDDELSELTGQDQYLAPERPSLEVLPGPLARETAQGAAEDLECMWWIVDVWEGSLPLFVFRTSPEAQAALIDGLRTSTLYTETTIDGERAFTSTFSDDLVVNQLVYVFVEDVWIAVVAPLEPDVAVAVAERALTAVVP